MIELSHIWVFFILIRNDLVDNANGEKKIYLDSRFYYCLVIAFFVCFVLIYAFANNNLILSDNSSKAFDKNWHYEDGTEVDFDNFVSDRSFTIEKNIEKGSLINKSLCFYSKNIYFTVFLDGNAIYDYHPNAPRLFGKSYGVYPHAISLPVLYDDCTLKITVDNLYPETPGFIHTIILGNGNSFLLNEIRKNAVEFLLCTLMMALGVVAFILGFAGKHFGDRRYEIISMGTFAIVASIWIGCETTFPALITGKPVAIHFVDYMMLAILPLPIVLFASFGTNNKESKAGLVVALFSSINLLTQILLTSLKIKDYHELLIISHIILGTTVICALVLFIKSLILKKVPKGLQIIMAITFLVPLVIGIVELIRYRIRPRLYRGTPAYQYVLFLFILLCCIYEFISISELSRKGQYAEIMEKMAYTDALTGLFNREYYNKFIDSELPEGEHYTFVMLDMNQLKDVNDNLGHLMGDEYIKSLANFIKEAFGENGTCFRMGGDEYLVISKLLSVDVKFLESLDTLYRKIDEYNEKKKLEIPLSTALGYADFSVGSRNVKEAVKEADAKMYERKKKMKENV